MYSNQLYNKQTLMSVSDVLSSKQDNVHLELYSSALHKFKTDMKLTDSMFSFTEQQNISSYFWIPTYVLVTQLDYPYKKCSYSLEKYWDYYDYNTSYNSIAIDPDYEIEDYDFIKGKAKLRSKHTNETMMVDFNSVDNLQKNEDFYRENYIFLTKEING